MRGLFYRIMRSSIARCTRGATAVEYGFIIALIVLAMMAALKQVATKTTGMWGNVSTCVQDTDTCPLTTNP